MESTDKQLKDKAIKFKGKLYVQVADRVSYFNQEYPNGSIQTQLVSDVKDDRVIVKAIVSPEPNRVFTGYSQARWDDTSSFVNKTSALENAETSAVGRALAMMGIGVIESIASMDEVNKAQITSPQPFKQTNTSEVVRDPVRTLIVHCEVCNEPMILKEGISYKKDPKGIPYSFYKCPKDESHPLRNV